MKVVRLSALCNGRFQPPGNIPKRVDRSQGHSAAKRIMSMKKSSDTIGERTHNLPACSAVAQPNALPLLGSKNLAKMFKDNKDLENIIQSSAEDNKLDDIGMNVIAPLKF
jgi:hypothetical protein